MQRQWRDQQEGPGFTHRDLGFDGCQLLLGSCEVHGGFTQCLALGFHITEYLVEPHDVDDPRAEARSRVGLGGHELGIELRVLQIRPDGFEAVLVDVLFVEVEEGIQEAVHFGHGDLRSLPAPILGHLAPRGHECHHCGTDIADSLGWGPKGLQLRQVGLGKQKEGHEKKVHERSLSSATDRVRLQSELLERAARKPAATF